MKKVLCLLLAILMVGGMFTACGKNPNGGTSSNATEGKNENGNTAVDKNTSSETYLVDQVVNLTNFTALHRNEEGLITSFERGHEKEFCCEYDTNGNLIKISKVGYNENFGQKTYYETPDDVWNFTYDADGKLVGYVHEGSDPWTYQYDENGRLTTIVLYGNVEVRYTYDAQGRVTAKRLHNNENLEDEYLFEYDAEGKLTKYHEINYMNGDVSDETYYTYSYDSGVVASFEMETHFSGRTNEQTVVCKYDDNGCMIEQEINGMTKMYEIKYAPMNLTAEQAERAMENTEFILTFTNHRIMPNELYVEWLS